MLVHIRGKWNCYYYHLLPQNFAGGMGVSNLIFWNACYVHGIFMFIYVLRFRYLYAKVIVTFVCSETFCCEPQGANKQQWF